METLRQHVAAANLPHLQVLQQIRCAGREQLIKLLALITDNGGEGVMLRQPGSFYEFKRSSTLLKLKKFIDDEAVVTGYEKIDINTAGKDHLRGAMGALHCRLTNGITFKVGNGFSDKQRLSPPKVGDTITFKYQELSSKGVPRFPTFVRVRHPE